MLEAVLLALARSSNIVLFFYPGCCPPPLSPVEICGAFMLAYINHDRFVWSRRICRSCLRVYISRKRPYALSERINCGCGPSPCINQVRTRRRSRSQCSYDIFNRRGRNKVHARRLLGRLSCPDHVNVRLDSVCGILDILTITFDDILGHPATTHRIQSVPERSDGRDSHGVSHQSQVRIYSNRQQSLAIKERAPS